MSVTIIKDLARAVLEQQDHHAARRKTDADEEANKDPPTVSGTGNQMPDPKTTEE
jgi:hypothetical protein